jgi:hypothetical protein
MIQFNLLPDVKLEYIKARRTKRLVIAATLLASAAALSVLVLLYGYDLLQQKHLADLNNDIKRDSKQLKQVPDLDKILTVQNQLNSLPALRDQTPLASRLAGYMTQVTPLQVNINKYHADLVAHTMIIDGTADALSTVNQYVDTLKFTKFKVDGETGEGTSAFTSVVLASFGRTEHEANYQITLNFDGTMLDSNKKVLLAVPKIISTRSETEKPLFKKPIDTIQTNTGGGSQ